MEGQEYFVVYKIMGTGINEKTITTKTPTLIG